MRHVAWFTIGAVIGMAGTVAVCAAMRHRPKAPFEWEPPSWTARNVSISDYMRHLRVVGEDE